MKKVTKIFLGITFCLCLNFVGMTNVKATEEEQNVVSSDNATQNSLNVDTAIIENETFELINLGTTELEAGEIGGSKTAEIIPTENPSETEGESREANVEIVIDAEGFNESSTTYEYLDIALVIDNSGSMIQNRTTIKVIDENGIEQTKTVTRLEAAKTASLELVKSLMSKNTETKTYFRISLSIFDNDGEVRKELTGTYSEIETAINNMTSGGGTNVQAGINNGGSTLYESYNDKVIIVLSDGETNESDGTYSYTDEEYKYKDAAHEIEYVYDYGRNNQTDYNAAKAAADFFKENENYGVTFYTIGFGTNANANNLLKYIAGQDAELDENGNPTYSRFLTANDGEELLSAFQRIVEVLTPRTDIATDAVLTDIIPTDFILSEEEKENIKTTYGENNVTFKETTNGTEITYNIGNISSTSPITFKYKVTAKDEYHGSMYTNYSASLTAAPTKGNPYKYTIDPETGKFTIILTKPSVLVPAITKDDNAGSVKSTETKTITTSSILSNDNNSYFTEGTQTENVSSLTDTIEIVSLPTNGTLTLNDAKTAYIYKPTTFGATADSFTYRIITKVIVGYNEDNTPIYETVKSNVSTVSLNIQIVFGNVIVKHVESGNTSNVISTDSTKSGQVGTGYTTSSKEIENWLFTNVIPTNATGNYTVEDITVYYEYTKVMSTLDVRHVWVDAEGKEQLILKSPQTTEQIGTEYKTTSLDKDTYYMWKLVSTPENVEGIYKEEPIIVTYIYEKIMGTLIVNYVDDNGKELLPSITTTEQVGTDYKTEETEIDEYILSKVDGRETGKYIDGEIEVTYIYEKAGIGGDEPIDTGLNNSILGESLLTIGLASLIKLLILKKKVR